MFRTIDQITFIPSIGKQRPYLGDRVHLSLQGALASPPVGNHCIKQVHGTKIVVAKAGQTDNASELPEADGLYSEAKGQRIAVKTADCLPVLIASRSQPFVCLVHAGWRGLCDGIVSEAAKIASWYGGPEDLFAFCGPCIGLAAFEVGPQVLEAFRQADNHLSDKQLAFAVARGKDDRWHMDIALLAAFQLIDAGLQAKNLTVLRSCTYSNPKLWHSYRRSGSANPSNWTMAWIHT